MDDLRFWVILAQLVNFSILFWIFYHFLGSKIVQTIEDRRKQLSSLENSDAEVKAKLEQAEVEAKQLIEKARSEAANIQKNADDLAKKNIENKTQEAEQKAQSILDAAQREIEKEKGSMMNALKEKVLDLSLSINSKVFDSKDSNVEFIKKEVNSIKI